MAEYVNVEKPFLEKLKECHWKVIDQGTGIPTDPHASMRSSFDEIALKTYPNHQFYFLYYFLKFKMVNKI